MLNSLDLLVIVALALAAAAVLSVALMFLARKNVIQKICFYIAVALGLYACYVGLYINWPMFLGQAALSAVCGLVSVAAFVIERAGGENKFGLARVLAAAALVVGLANALLL